MAPDYTFGANSSRDDNRSHDDRSRFRRQHSRDRGSRRRSRSPLPYNDRRDTSFNSYRPLDRDRENYPRRDRSDNYPPQGSFTFRMDKPSGVGESRDSYDGRHGRDPFPPRRGGRGRGRDGDRRRDFAGRGGRRWAPFAPSERPMLLARRGDSPELLFGVDDSKSKFRSLEDLSDEEEINMDISDRDSDDDDDDDGDDGNGDTNNHIKSTTSPSTVVATMSNGDGQNDSDPSTQRAAKRARREENSDANPADNVPKWSNPDPYTALPPPDETLTKKINVVALIRKARLEAEDDNPAASGAPDDFICFDSDDDDGQERKPQAKKLADSFDSTTAVTAPSSSLPLQQTTTAAIPPRPHGLPAKPVIDLSNNQSSPQSSQPPPPQSPPPPPPPPPSSLLPPLPSGVPPPPAVIVVEDSNRVPAVGPLGSRKRTIDDDIKPIKHVPIKRAMTGSKKSHLSSADVISEWRPVKGHPSCPWLTVEHSTTPETAVWLHKEIVDFYNYVRPRDYEHRIRSDLVERLRNVLSRTGPFRDAEVHVFGSFVSELYLPTGDMDLVICSKAYMRGGYGTLAQSKWLYKLRHILQDNGLSDGSVQCIAKAKVPLVKYVDRESGLKVDVSFENLTGVDACQTFLDWKEQYPAMPILVTLIKHFLAMRGLNEPVNGGIGGFSVICLVVSMLQLMPQVQSRNMRPEHHLGEMLMEFFALYGKQFDYQNTAIRLNPPGYLHKNRVTSLVYKNHDRLSIIDPNNSQNDISGGSSNTATILYDFRIACDELYDRLAELSKLSENERKGQSILECLFAGNYESFTEQRSHLKFLHDRRYGRK